MKNNKCLDFRGKNVLTLKYFLLKKVLELVCAREAGAVFEAGGLSSVLQFIREHGAKVHQDTLYSAMSSLTTVCQNGTTR